MIKMIKDLKMSLYCISFFINRFDSQWMINNYTFTVGLFEQHVVDINDGWRWVLITLFQQHICNWGMSVNRITF